MVNQYTNEIIDLITKDVTPKELCSIINVCTASDLNANDQNVDHDETKESGEWTEDQISRDMMTVCSHFPKFARRRCRKFFLMDSSRIIDSTMQHLSNTRASI